MRAYLCLSQSKDVDLFGLYKDIGTINFRKVAKLCITGIFDEKAALKAREIALSGKDGGGHSEKYSGGIKIRINISSKECAAEYILSSLKPRAISVFIKTCIRQVLGPQILLKYFMKHSEEISTETITFKQSPLIMSVEQEPVRPVRKRRVTLHSKQEEEAQSTLPSAVIPQTSQGDSTNAADATSYPVIPPVSQATVQTAPAEQAEQPIQNQEDNNTDGFDMLSMLEAMM